MKYQRSYLSKKQITKDLVHKKICGVCAGLAKYYSLPRIVVRVIAVIAALNFPLLVGVAYLTAAALLPTR